MRKDRTDRLAGNLWHLSALRWNAETSMLKTLAAKHKSTVTKTAARYKAKVSASDGLLTCFCPSLASCRPGQMRR